MPKDTEPRKKEECKKDWESVESSSEGALEVPDELYNELSIDFKVTNPGQRVIMQSLGQHECSN